MKKWNNAELVALSIEATASGNNELDVEGTAYQKDMSGGYEPYNDVRYEIGPKAATETPVTVDSLS